MLFWVSNHRVANCLVLHGPKDICFRDGENTRARTLRTTTLPLSLPVGRDNSERQLHKERACVKQRKDCDVCDVHDQQL